MKRYLEFIGADSSRASGQAEKFWEITVAESEIRVRFGKVGANGQTTLKSFPDAAAASREAEKLVKEKMKKGYLEVQSAGESGKIAPGAVNLDETAFGELTADQRKVMAAFAEELFDVVSTYGISPLNVEEDDLDEDDIASNRVWSIVEYYAVGNAGIAGVEDDSYKTDAMLAPGYEEGAFAHHVAEKPYSEEQPLKANPYTTLFFVCSACDSAGCDECDGSGELIFGALWDGKGVSFSRE
jgi:predicted DNA-binding WGR domain protein